MERVFSSAQALSSLSRPGKTVIAMPSIEMLAIEIRVAAVRAGEDIVMGVSPLLLSAEKAETHRRRQE